LTEAERLDVAGGLAGFPAGAVGEFVSRLRDGGVAGLPFGLYEAPSPYKRLLSPEMMAWAGRLQQFLVEGEATLSVRYPLSAKLMAGWAGVPIEPVCRQKVVELTAAQTERLRGLRTAADRLLS